LGDGPRRSVLDGILVDAAVECGAELRGAAIAVGADGRNSCLARAVDAPVYDSTKTLLCYYFSNWSGVESCQFELYQRTRERRVIFLLQDQRPAARLCDVTIARLTPSRYT
jgi:hypothetical protein